MSNKNEDKIEFSNLLKDSNNLNEYHTKFAWHVAWHNKLMIWCKMLNNVYLTVKLYTILGFSSYYFYAKVIKHDALVNALDLVGGFEEVLQEAIESEIEE